MEEREAFEFLADQAVDAAKGKVITTKDGHTFLVGGNVQNWYEDNRAEYAIATHTLSSLVKYIKAGIDGRKELYVHIKSPMEVALLGALDEHGKREKLMKVTLAQENFDFGEFQDREQLNIALQSMFESTPDRDAIIDFISHLKEDTDSTEVVDDGVSQTATIKTGVATVGKGLVPNPVTLKPYRTFTEVEQPESTFVFRMREGMQGAIIEADGGMWKNVAINRIQEYLEKELAGTPATFTLSILG